MNAFNQLLLSFGGYALDLVEQVNWQRQQTLKHRKLRDTRKLFHFRRLSLTSTTAQGKEDNHRCRCPRIPLLLQLRTWPKDSSFNSQSRMRFKHKQLARVLVDSTCNPRLLPPNSPVVLNSGSKLNQGRHSIQIINGAVSASGYVLPCGCRGHSSGIREGPLLHQPSITQEGG